MASPLRRRRPRHRVGAGLPYLAAVFSRQFTPVAVAEVPRSTRRWSSATA
ncbi:cytochrome oxidase assembly domain protein [Mycobacterium xenopi 3993]|nr:cytochrome oxidase assembly domain protein [Mycobacterium xenopi 3993]